ncbi:MAG: hypothetical protein SVM80_07900, partial [Halobacteriota archaeon]|nr:hypothetical protein [Halobacteriota archaeon]
CWTYTCVKRSTYFFVAFASGKWTQETCERMIKMLFERTELPFPDNKIEIFTDGNDDYTHILPDYYDETCINYGQIIKIRIKEEWSIKKEKRIIYGNPDPGDIETTDVSTKLVLHLK